MKADKLFLLCFLYLTCSYPQLQAQTFEPLYSFSVESPVAVTADTYGRLFIANQGGEIRSYSPTGDLLYVFSPQSAAYFSTLDARGLQLLAFDENSQQLVFLDRYLNELSTFLLPPDLFSYATAMSGSADHSIWLADAGILELKKWKPGSRELQTSINLSRFRKESSLEIVALKEYQHKLYLFTTRQLYVFDRLGTLEKALPLPVWKSFSFAGNQLLLLTEQSLHRFPLYTGEVGSMLLPEGGPYTHFLFSEGIYYFFNEETATAYRQRP